MRKPVAIILIATIVASVAWYYTRNSLDRTTTEAHVVPARSEQHPQSKGGDNIGERLPGAVVFEPIEKEQHELLESGLLQAESEGFQPSKLYQEYLRPANAGDADAQYILSTALLECLNVASTEEEFDLDRLERSNLPEELIEHARQRFWRCQPLHEAVQDLQKEYQHWYAEAANAGHPLILMKQQNMPTQERVLLLRQAVTAGYPEPHLYATAFAEVARFYRSDPAHRDGLLEEAWGLLACDARAQCDADKERRALREKYHTHDINEIVEREMELRTAVLRRDREALGF